MDFHDERDELAGDDEPEMDAGATYRDLAAAKLDQIAHDAKRALAENDIGIDLFFMIPSSGVGVLTFGTVADPSDDLWDTVGEIVSLVVRKSVGLKRTTCRALQCATADTTPIA